MKFPREKAEDILRRWFDLEHGFIEESASDLEALFTEALAEYKAGLREGVENISESCTPLDLRTPEKGGILFPDIIYRHDVLALLDEPKMYRRVCGHHGDIYVETCSACKESPNTRTSERREGKEMRQRRPYDKNGNYASGYYPPRRDPLWLPDRRKSGRRQS